VRTSLEEKSVLMESAELTMIPQNTVKLEGKSAEQLMKLMDSLDEHDDVQNVYANFDIDDAELERLLGE
jgi:transcriptional/translational regulatory protein YebC/TACO1